MRFVLVVRNALGIVIPIPRRRGDSDTVGCALLYCTVRYGTVTRGYYTMYSCMDMDPDRQDTSCESPQSHAFKLWVLSMDSQLRCSPDCGLCATHCIL